MAKRKKKLSLFQVIQTHESDWYTELPAFGLWRSKHPRKFTNVLRVVTSIKEQPKYRQWSTYMVSPQCQLVPLVVPCLLSRLYIYIFTERLLQSLVVSLTKLSSPEMHLHHKKSSKCNLVAMLTRCWHLLMVQLLYIIQDYIWRHQSRNKVYDVPFLVSEEKKKIWTSCSKRWI